MANPLLDIPQEVRKGMKLCLMNKKKRSLLVYNAIKACVKIDKDSQYVSISSAIPLDKCLLSIF